jgi:hypothetical protein
MLISSITTLTRYLKTFCEGKPHPVKSWFHSSLGAFEVMFYDLKPAALHRLIDMAPQQFGEFISCKRLGDFCRKPILGGIFHNRIFGITA